MRSTAWKKLASEPLGVSSSKWRFAGSLAFLADPEWIVHGVLAEKSAGRSDQVYLWVVKLPLVVPHTVVALSWSERLGGGTTSFRVEEPTTLTSIEAAGRKAVLDSSASSRFIVDPPGGSDNVRMQEARAYGLVLEGNFAGAREVLLRVAGYAPKYDWEHVLIDRAGAMRALLDAGDERGAVDVIAGWRVENLGRLGLSRR